MAGDALEHLRSAFRAPRSSNWRDRDIGCAAASEHLSKGPPRHQFDIAPSRKLKRIRGKVTRTDDNAARRALRSHEAVEFTDRRHTDLLGSPLLALYEGRFAPLRENEIHSPVGATTARVRDREAVSLKARADEALEVLPGESTNRPRWVSSRVGKQNCVAPSARERSSGANKKGERQEVLQEAGDRREELPTGEDPKLAGVCWVRWCRAREDVKQDIQRTRQSDTDCPRKPHRDLHEVLKKPRASAHSLLP